MPQQQVKTEKRRLRRADVTGLDAQRILKGLTTDRGIYGLHCWIDLINGREILSGYMHQEECPVPFLPERVPAKREVTKVKKRKSADEFSTKQAESEGLFGEADPFPSLPAEANSDTPTDRGRDAALRDCKG